MEYFISVFLVVKASVPDDIVNDFDSWYENFHLHDAHNLFKSISSFRGWINGNQHRVFYEFKDFETANKLLKSEELKIMIKKFDTKWSGEIKKSRELLKIVQKI